jgi:hypothetical protein
MPLFFLSACCVHNVAKENSNFSVSNSSAYSVNAENTGGIHSIELSGLKHGAEFSWDFGDIKIFVSTEKDREEEEFFSPILEIVEYDNPVFTIKSEAVRSGWVHIYFSELDRSNSKPEIIYMSYTGGAHCCQNTSILTYNDEQKAWKKADELWLDPIFHLDDINHDAEDEFIFYDPSFNYAFGCYACGGLPLKIMKIENGKLQDVTSDKKYKSAHEQNLVDILANINQIIETGDTGCMNKQLAAFAATKSALGNIDDEDWDFIGKHLVEVEPDSPFAPPEQCETSYGQKWCMED